MQHCRHPEEAAQRPSRRMAAGESRAFMVRDGAARLLTMRVSGQGNKLEGVALALDMPGVEMTADHQNGLFGKARKQRTAGLGRLLAVAVGGRRPAKMRHLAGVVSDIPRQQAFLAIRSNMDAHMAGAVAWC